MITKMRLRNLRSFPATRSSPYITIKPITVLVGKNSSGKSSFIRSLPLLRQSVEAKTTGPILWYGSYVDFGAFSETLGNESDGPIYFDFEIDVPIASRRTNYYRPYYWRQNSAEQLKVEIELGVAERKGKTVASSLVIKLEDFEFLFNFDTNNKCSLHINGAEELTNEQLSYRVGRDFLPQIYESTRFEKISDTIQISMNHRRMHDDGVWYLFIKKMLPTIKRHFHKNTSDETIMRVLARNGIVEKDQVYRILKQNFRGNSTFEKNLEKNKEVIVKEFHKLMISSSINDIIEYLNFSLEEDFRSVRYIAPLRATAERYYRHQDLQVEEIDHTGSNLAMFLKSFSDKEKEEFSTWTMSNFGFRVRVYELGLHYALKIKTDDDPKEYNINDMGFGFSQILPIVASIWVETTRPRSRNRQLIFSIEQPELHLHPEYQSRLAKLFCKVISEAQKNKVNIRLIFETHSKTMVDTIGDCVEDDIINMSDVNIVLFEKEFDSSKTSVRFAKFNSEGTLENWPIGFFSGR